MVNLTSADISGSAGAQTILDAIRTRWPWVKHLFAYAAYDRLKLMDKAAYLNFVLEFIRRRRLVRDDERRIDVSTAMIHVAMGGLLLRRNLNP